MQNIYEWLKQCRRTFAHPAHRAERPMHILYFLLVGYYGGGPYGVAAVGCAIITIFASGDEPPHA